MRKLQTKKINSMLKIFGLFVLLVIVFSSVSIEVQRTEDKED